MTGRACASAPSCWTCRAAAWLAAPLYDFVAYSGHGHSTTANYVIRPRWWRGLRQHGRAAVGGHLFVFFGLLADVTPVALAGFAARAPSRTRSARELRIPLRVCQCGAVLVLDAQGLLEGGLLNIISATLAATSGLRPSRS